MEEVDIVRQLSGQFGGIFGLGMLVGGSLMHMANVRVIDPYRQRAHDAVIQSMKDRIATLEAHIKELDKFRADYMAILEAHSGPTLHPKERRE